MSRLRCHSSQTVLQARARLRELSAQLRTDADTVADAHTKALFATTSDLLTALEQAFADADHHAAPTWRA